MSTSDCIVVIPARLGSTRLPGKPLADILGKPMILHVWERSCRAAVGPVVVACADAEIAEIVEKAGGNAVWVKDPVPTGSDIVFQAVEAFDPKQRYAYVLNVQGDLPVFEPSLLMPLLLPLQVDHTVSISTPVVRKLEAGDLEASHVVKAKFETAPAAHQGVVWGNAVGFSRMPYTKPLEPWYQHIGVYAYRREALKAFVGMPQSDSEKRESLEQLRALDNGLTIAGVVVDVPLPLSVDTPDDLENVKAFLRASPEKCVA
ncbi:MAG: 3-deoxy-manno-octulosonate cytidylyltransferase [Alphaproteobacteria bacterium]